MFLVQFGRLGTISRLYDNLCQYNEIFYFLVIERFSSSPFQNSEGMETNHKWWKLIN